MAGIASLFTRDLGAVLTYIDRIEAGLVRVNGDTVWSRGERGRFPDSAELKQLVRDRIAPGKDLGHSDRKSVNSDR